MKKFKENSVNTVGFVLHAVEFHKPTGAVIMKYTEKFFWIWAFLIVVATTSNILGL